MASLLPMLASIGFIVWQVCKVRSRIKGFKPMAKLLLGDDLQNPKLNEETARQILSLIQTPFPLFLFQNHLIWKYFKYLTLDCEIYEKWNLRTYLR